MAFKFSKAILNWYDQHGRKDLPWQQDRTPYRVWVSEIMLQQTQVKTVIPYFEKFMQSFPHVVSLADAHEDDVLHHWSGLGYYARARNLHKAARQVRDQHGGEFPQQFEDVLDLPGIGRSTAGAILAQATGQRHAILDGNVKRVLARFHAIHGWTGQARVQDQLWVFAEQHTPQQRLADYTQGMMDLGATLCTRSRPDCEACPLNSQCEAHATDQVSLLPTPRPKKTLPVKSVRMLLLSDDEQQVLLEKRPPTGIWGGLWSLPEMPMDNPRDEAESEAGQAIEAWCETHLQLDVEAPQDLPVMRHTFSHYHLDITPCRLRLKNPAQSVMEADRRVWYKATQKDAQAQAPGHNLGLAAPVTTLLNRINEE